VQEILNLGRLVPAGASIAPSVIRGALWVEGWLNIVGARPLIRRSPLAGLSNLNVYHEVTKMLRTIPQVTVAAINGRAFGGGCELAMACDFRIMVDTPPEGTPDSRGSGIGQPEITLGLTPGGGGTQMLTRLFGPAKALEICLLRPLISAQEALELGLITKLVPREALIKETVELAVMMSRRAPTAVAAIKDSVHNGAALSMMAGMRREQGNFGASAMNPESQAAMQQYLKEIDTLLGSEGGIEDFKPLVEGTFVDMIPEGVSMSKYLSQSLKTTSQPVAIKRKKA
jgi:enoyl-CoA hydratase